MSKKNAGNLPALLFGNIMTENLTKKEIEKLIEAIWLKAYNYGPSIEHWTGTEMIATSDIVQRISDYELDNIIKKLQIMKLTAK